MFSLGDHRRKIIGTSASLPPDYFTPGDISEETAKLRRRVKTSLEDDVLDFFNEKRGQVAIYDANVSATGGQMLSEVEQRR